VTVRGEAKMLGKGGAGSRKFCMSLKKIKRKEGKRWETASVS